MMISERRAPTETRAPRAAVGDRMKAVVALRDAALKHALVSGVPDKHPGTAGWVFAELGPFKISYRSPFGRWPEPKPAASYEQAIALQQLQREKPTLRESIDIWHDKKVLSAQWTGDTVEIISFRRGPWEAAFLAEARTGADL